MWQNVNPTKIYYLLHVFIHCMRGPQVRMGIALFDGGTGSYWISSEL